MVHVLVCPTLNLRRRWLTPNRLNRLPLKPALTSLPNKKNFDNFMHLAGLLEDLLQRRVEIITTEALSPYIGPHILSEVEYASLSS